MAGDAEFLELFGKHSTRPGVAPRAAEASAAEADVESCLAYGFLRGLHERALALELRLRSGEREWYPYSHLAAWRYNPSAGLLLKFTSDIVTLVLVHGSNLDVAINDSGVNLTDRGLQRHRILWIREMDEDELHKAGNDEPTIDRFDVAELESNEEVKEYLKKSAPAFIR